MRERFKNSNQCQKLPVTSPIFIDLNSKPRNLLDLDKMSNGKDMLKDMSDIHEDIDSLQHKDVNSDLDFRNAHGISYPNRLRKNVMMVRVFNGYLSETKDEAMDRMMKVEIQDKAYRHVKSFIKGISSKRPPLSRPDKPLSTTSVNRIMDS